ncbi:MAG: amidohydrolase family protein [Pyrinomonadaceae bacterium]|nr:amidohydrolase family protein [Phycisphaerales bacterium]
MFQNNLRQKAQALGGIGRSSLNSAFSLRPIRVLAALASGGARSARFSRPAAALLAFTVPLLLAPAAFAQDLGIKAPAQAKPIAITNAVVHTVSGQTYPSGYVIFDKGKITAIGDNALLPRLTSEVSIIDVGGKHVYPGMIGAYTQLGLTEISTIRASNDMSEVGSGGINPEVRGCVAVNPDSTLIPVTRSNGVLTVGVFPAGGTLPGRASVMVLDGWTYEDMTVKDVAGVIVNWPMSRPITAWWMDTPEEEQLKNIRLNMLKIEDAFTQASAYARAKAADPASPVDLRWEAMRGVFSALPNAAPSSATPGSPSTPALAGAAASTKPAVDPRDGRGVRADTRTPVFVMAQDYDQITSAVEFCNRLGLRCIIVGGRDAPQCTDLLQRHHIPVILLGVHRMPQRDDSAFDEPFTVAVKLQQAGVQWCMASGEETAHERNLPYNAARAVGYGLDLDAAMRSVTLSPAEILGVSDTLGSLEVGKSATLLITDGNPLEITTRIDSAYIHGKKIDLANKQTELEKKYREKYRQLNSGKGESPAPAKSNAPPIGR